MIKFIINIAFLIFLTSCGNKEELIVKKIEHYYISSNQASSIFKILTKDFGLPEVWPFKSWGGFKSGGVTLGNVVIEIVENNNIQTKTQYGIALEPSIALNKTNKKLDSMKVAHGNINHASEWETMSIKNSFSRNVDLFFCRYYDHDNILKNRINASAKLSEINGGPLGIEFLKEIIVESANSEESEVDFLNFKGVYKELNLLKFPSGPSLKFVNSDTFSFIQVVKVKDFKNARDVLNKLNIKNRLKAEGLYLEDDRLPMKIILVDK